MTTAQAFALLLVSVQSVQCWYLLTRTVFLFSNYLSSSGRNHDNRSSICMETESSAPRRLWERVHLFSCQIMEGSTLLRKAPQSKFGEMPTAEFAPRVNVLQPMLDHSFVAGHLLSIKPIMDRYPKDAHKVYTFGEMSRKFPKSGAYYLDLWPLSNPFLMVTSPTLADQATQTTSVAYERPDALRKWFLSIAGGQNLFDAHGKDWKPLRALFNPGFSTRHLLTLVPVLMEEILIYCETLRLHAKIGDTFYLDPTTLRFTVDIIGRVVLLVPALTRTLDHTNPAIRNAQLNAQRGPNPLADALLNQIQLKITNQETDPLQWLNVVRPIMEWRNGRQMDTYIHKELDKRFETLKANGSDNKQFKSVIDLALQDYLADSAKKASGQLDSDFRAFATRNIRMFLFAGHDSTSSTICYCYYLLYANPTTLAHVRAEYDSIFGTNLAITSSLISDKPELLNQIPYTHAVIKEAMRLFPAASGIRQGASNVDLIDDEGNKFPTENTMIWILHQEMQRSPRYWKRPTEFLPERWLVDPDDPLYPVKGAWRPFEFGPRKCVGQGLVMIQIKAILAMTVREFDIVPMYDEWDGSHFKKGARTVDGERVYQTEEGAAHPSDHYPCKVLLRSSEC